MGKENFSEIKNEIKCILDEAYEVRTHNLKRSIRLAKKAVLESERLLDKPLIGKSLNMLALFYMIRAEYNDAIELSKKAIKIFEDLGDEIGIADAKYNMASIFYKTDNFHSGLTYLIHCLRVYRAHDNQHQVARVLKALGTIYEYFGDEKRAIDTYLECIEAAKLANDLNLESNALNPLSGIYLNRGNIDRAMKLIQKSIEIKIGTGDIRGLAFALYGRAKVYTATKEFERAEIDLKEALKIHLNAGEKLGLAMAYHKLGKLYIEWKKNNLAIDYLTKASEFSIEYSIALIKYKCNYLLYELYKSLNDTQNALKYLEIYLREKEAVINTQTLKVIENYDVITKMESLKKEAQLQKEKAEIIKKKEFAEQSARVKQEFLSTMSHEIRTPLNAVISISSMLGEARNEDEQQLLNSLKFSANNLLYIINDILDFTKLDAGKVELDFRPCALKEHIKNICRTYEGLATEKGIELNLILDDNLNDFYSIDETKLSQIMGNLISNAIKFTDHGSVSVHLNKLKSNHSLDTVRFNVIDTGSGISEDFQKKLFDSFSQFNSARNKKIGGSGLGLAIVKKLVQLKNSEIYLESKVGEGSNFYFDLLLKQSDKPISVPKSPSKILSGLSILLAEDNRINAMVLGKLLNRWNVHYDHAMNGDEVLEKAKLKKYDFILMDIHMPIMDGFEATTELKKGESINKKTPIYALTADITAEQNDEYKRLFNGFLLKPIEQEKLYELFTSHTV